jgi:hypothetical protein
MDRPSSQCLSCEGQGGSQLAILIVVPLVLLGVGAFFILYLRNAYTLVMHRQASTGSMPLHVNVPRVRRRAWWKRVISFLQVRVCDTTPIGGDNTMPSHHSYADANPPRHGLSQMIDFEEVMPKVKIVVTAFQIISQFPDSLAIDFPGLAGSVIHGLTFVNLLTNLSGSPQVSNRRFN